MSVLDLARRAYARAIAHRNGVTDHPSPPVRDCEISEKRPRPTAEVSASRYLLVREQAVLQTVIAALCDADRYSSPVRNRHTASRGHDGAYAHRHRHTQLKRDADG